MADWEARRSSEWDDHAVYLNQSDYQAVVAHLMWLVLSGYIVLIVPLPLLPLGAFVGWWHGREAWRVMSRGMKKPPTR